MGKSVKLIVREARSVGIDSQVAAPYDAFFALPGTHPVDPHAFRELPAASRFEFQ